MSTTSEKVTTADVQQLRAAAAVAAQKAAEAAERADAAAASEAARREARMREWDERTLAEFDQDALRIASEGAMKRVHDAIAGGGNVFAAWMDYRLAHGRLYERTAEARSAAARLGQRQPGADVSSVHEDLNAVVKTAISDAALRQTTTEQDERAVARDRYVADARSARRT